MRYWLILVALLALASSAVASPYRIEVTKSKRQLVLYKNEVAVKTCHVALGKNPSGPKRARGDKRTPEGHYYICGKQVGQFGPFLRVSYPAPDDAKEALGSGRIKPGQYREIVKMASRGGVPPQETWLGGNIGIHGWSRRFSPRTSWHDWTAGCIALTNEDARELYSIVPVGTRLDIRP